MTIISFCIFLITVTSCNAQEKFHSGGPYYYESFATYKLPPHPVGELNPEEAKKRDSYYIAYFDDNGKIVSFSKYLYGKLEFSAKYTYTQEGYLERRELTKASGEVVIQYFDKKGRIIQKK
mgnify:FL=1